MIDKWLVKVKAHHAWRFIVVIVVFVLAVIIWLFLFISVLIEYIS